MNYELCGLRSIIIPFLLLTASLVGNNCKAQQLPMTMEQMFKTADEQSLALAASQQSVEEAQAAVLSAKSARTPDIDVNLQLSLLGNAWICDRDFSNGFNSEMPRFGNMFSLAVTQVLYAGGAIKNSIGLAELRQTMAELAHAQNVQAIRILLAGHYLDLCQMRNQKEILEKNIALTEKLVDDIQANYNAGTALKSDITRYELQLQDLKLRLTQTEDQIDIVNRNLVEMLNLPEGTTVVPDTSIVKNKQVVPAEEYWQEAIMQSPAVMQSSSAIQVSNKAEDIAKAGMRPTVALRIEDNFNGPITVEVPTIDKNLNYWYAGVGVSYNIGSLYKQKRKVSESHLATTTAQTRHDALLNDMQAKVHAAYVRFREAQEVLKTSEKSVQLAHENYDVVHYRYLNGMALITDMLDATNQQVSAELRLMNAEINIVYNHYMLMGAVGLL